MINAIKNEKKKLDNRKDNSKIKLTRQQMKKYPKTTKIVFWSIRTKRKRTCRIWSCFCRIIVEAFESKRDFLLSSFSLSFLGKDIFGCSSFAFFSFRSFSTRFFCGAKNSDVRWSLRFLCWIVFWFGWFKWLMWNCSAVSSDVFVGVERDEKRDLVGDIDAVFAVAAVAVAVAVEIDEERKMFGWRKRSFIVSRRKF